MIDRRTFAKLTGASAATVSLAGLPDVAASAAVPGGRPASFGALKQVDAGELTVGYADVAPLLAARGYRVIVPYLRGHGTTRFRSARTFRNAQQSVVALDVIALMDALKIREAVLGGFDWGSRTADIIAALWPSRCKALVSVTGYLITNRDANKTPLPPKAERAWWYQYYFATERGREGFARYHHDLARLVWEEVSPTWRFDDATFERTATAFTNPDYVPIVIHNYRWRLGLAEGDPRYDGIERRLAKAPSIGVPTVTLDGELDPFTPAGGGSSYRDHFTGRYVHWTLKGIGHNVPQEAPGAFAAAVVEADRL